MTDDLAVLRTIYRHFNDRNIDGVMPLLLPDVCWANGMDGGHVRGRDAVREYWSRQWELVSPHVEPLGFAAEPDGVIVATVRQTVRTAAGAAPVGAEHGLRDRTVAHVFRMRNGAVARFDIRDA